MVIDTRACDCTTRNRISSRRDFVGLQREVSDIITCLRHGESIGSRCGDLGATFGPVDKGVTRVGSSR